MLLNMSQKNDLVRFREEERKKEMNWINRQLLASRHLQPVIEMSRSELLLLILMCL